MDDKTIQQLKWAIFTVAIGGIAYFALPIMAKLALDAVTIILCGVGVFSLWMFLPALSEALAQISYRLWELAIRADPIAKCRRGLEAHSVKITVMEDNISKARSGVAALRKELRDPNLSLEDRDEWNGQLRLMEAGIEQLETMRNEALQLHEKMKREIDRAEAKLRVGKAFKSVVSVFSFNSTDGKEAMGARIALQEVDKQLNDSTSQLQTILSRNVGQRPQLTSAAVVETPVFKIPKNVAVN